MIRVTPSTGTMDLFEPEQMFDALECVGDQSGQRRHICQVERAPFANPAPVVRRVGAEVEAEAVLENDRADLGPKLAGGRTAMPATAPLGCMKKFVQATSPPGSLVEETSGLRYFNPVQRRAVVARLVAGPDLDAGVEDKLLDVPIA